MTRLACKPMRPPTRTHRRAAPRTLAAAALALGTLGAPALAQPTIINLGVLPGGFSSRGIALSGDGTTVVGSDLPLPGNIRAFRWSQSTGLQPLAGLGGVTSVNALSGDGSVIVGASEPALPLSSPLAARWTSPTTVQSLGTLGTGSSSSANGVSGDGSVVVGASATNGSGNYRAFRWTQGGGMQDLGVLPSGTDSFAYGISAGGTVITGSSTVGGTPRAFRSTQATGMQDLGVIGGFDQSTGQGVSGDGSTIVGYIGDLLGDTGSRGFRWTQGGGMQNLGVLAGGAFSAAFAANADGTRIVGTSTSSLGDTATLWTPSLGLVDLNTYLPSLGADLTGWALDSANGISLDGSTITGSGYFNGQYRAFVVTNVPAPGAAAVIGLVGLTAARRRRL